MSETPSRIPEESRYYRPPEDFGPEFRGTIERANVQRSGDEYLESLGFTARFRDAQGRASYRFIDVAGEEPRALQETGKKRLISRELTPNREELRRKFEGKAILDIGAGARGFAAWLEKNKIDANAVSLDPSYASMDEFYHGLEERLEAAKFAEKKKLRGSIFQQSPKTTRRNLEAVTKDSMSDTLDTQSVAGVGHQIPFRDEAFDYLLAVFSLPGWARNKEDIRNFLLEAYRVLKPGGELRVSPFSWKVAPTTRRSSGTIPVENFPWWEELQKELQDKFDIYINFGKTFGREYHGPGNLAILRKKLKATEAEAIEK